MTMMAFIKKYMTFAKKSIRNQMTMMAFIKKYMTFAQKLSEISLSDFQEWVHP
jgi:hypothetical protein